MVLKYCEFFNTSFGDFFLDFFFAFLFCVFISQLRTFFVIDFLKTVLRPDITFLLIKFDNLSTLVHSSCDCVFNLVRILS